MQEKSLLSREYFPDLDASRFLAFLAVFLFHSIKTADETIVSSSAYALFRSHIDVAHMGVDYFFTLSSFLISYLLLLEISKNKQINAPAYLMRRILRIWPLYFFVLFLGFLAIPFVYEFIAPSESLSIPDSTPFILFYSNFYMMNHGASFLFVLTILWTVSVEEQFYLVWPFLCKLGIRYFPLICLLLILVSVASRFILNDQQSYFHSLTYCANFGIGGLAAFLVVISPQRLKTIKQLSKSTHFMLYALFAAACLSYPYWKSVTILNQLEQLIFALLFAYFILEQSFSKNSFFKLRGFKIMSKLGKLSYGLYVYEALAITGISFLYTRISEESFWSLFLIIPVTSFFLTISIALLSNRFLEQPFLRIKQRYRKV